MYIKKIPILLVCLSLAGCAHVNRYEGGDAVSIYKPCEAGIGTTNDGVQYTAYVEINQVDRKFTGSGNDCPRVGYTYKIAPGTRTLTFISNFFYTNLPKSSFGKFDVVANLEAGKEYVLKTSFDGATIRAQVIDKQSGSAIAEGRTQKFKESYQGNGPLMAIPFIVK